MAQDEQPLLAAVKAELARLATELRRLVDVRLQLARLELRAAVKSTRRLALALLSVVLIVLVTLPVLVLALSDWLQARYDVGPGILPGSIGGGLLLVALAIGALSWRRFRREFVGFEETLEELHEDLVWLKEWTGGTNRSDDEAAKNTEHENRAPTAAGEP
jgi:uncharacterized membrane protein YqjE